MLKTERLILAPFSMRHLNEYVAGFTARITEYQWPDPFENTEQATDTLQAFLEEMERGETLFYSVLSKDEAFLGSVEVHGLAEDCPELGVWIAKAEQNKGYALEALDAVMDHVLKTYGKSAFYYEADVRNLPSRKLLHKFEKDYEIHAQEPERFTTDSGKELELQGFVLKARER